MSEKNITLDDKTEKIPLLRENDLCLMTEFRTNDAINPTNLPTLNKCCIYLVAFTLSDISSGGGTSIRDEACHGRKYDNR